jgi:hypothetical protein
MTARGTTAGNARPDLKVPLIVYIIVCSAAIRCDYSFLCRRCITNAREISSVMKNRANDRMIQVASELEIPLEAITSEIQLQKATILRSVRFIQFNLIQPLSSYLYISKLLAVECLHSWRSLITRQRRLTRVRRSLWFSGLFNLRFPQSRM